MRIFQTKYYLQDYANQFKKRKVHSPFIDDIWGADLADMKLISKFNKGIRFLCVIDIFSKYAWVIQYNNTYQRTMICSGIKI